MILSLVTGSSLMISITLVTQCITSAAHVIQQRPHPMLHGSFFFCCLSRPQLSLSSSPSVNIDNEDALYKDSRRERETLTYMRNRRQASCAKQCHRYRWIQVNTAVSRSLCLLLLYSGNTFLPQSEPQFLVEVPLPRAVPTDCLSVAISCDTIAISIPGESNYPTTTPVDLTQPVLTLIFR